MKNFTLLKNWLSVIILLIVYNVSGQTIVTTYSTSTTITVPLGVTSINVQAWGGGGKGGSRSTGSGGYGGGGGGAFASSNVSVTGGSTYTITVGSGSTSNSSDGGDSWFINNTSILAKGGKTVPNNTSTGGLGGTAAASIGTTKFSGGNGVNGVTSLYGGGGGSSAGTAAAGSTGLLNAGGIAPAGGGDGGDGAGSNGNGNIGISPGGGGGGALRTGGNPTGGDGANGQIILTYTIPPQPEIDIQGNATSIVDGDTTPTIADWTDFGSSSVAVGITRTFTIYNTGTANLTIGAITFTGTNASDFAVTSAPSATVIPGGNTTLTVTFTPSGFGNRTATINIVNNDFDENPYDFSIRGFGNQPEIDVKGNAITIVDGDTTPTPADWTDYGNSNIGVGITRTYTIFNTGLGNLYLGAITFTGTNASDFAVTSAPSATVIPGGSTTITVTFTPGANGIRIARINIANNDLDENPYDFSIQGTGVTPLTNGPGGVMSNLQLWFRSDLLNGTTGVADGSAVNTWNTLGRGSNAIRPGSVGAPIYRNNPAYNINFNSVVDFTNNPVNAPQNYTDLDPARQYLKGPTGFYTEDIFAVVIPDINVTSTTASLDIFCGDRVPATNQTDGTGIGYGRYTNRFNNEVLTFCLGTTSGSPPSGYGVAHTDASGTATYNEAGIINASNNALGNGQNLTFNANNIVTNTNDPADFGNVNNSQFWMGRSEGWDGSWDGRIGEIITLDSRASDADRNKILSYLAIKYGITLGVNGTSVSYTNSAYNTIWNATANAGYNYDIAGIGRDDLSRLNQKQSKSINPTEVMTIGLTDIYTTNTANTNTFGVNNNYLVWGSNGGTMVNSGAPINVDLGPTTITTITEVVNRRWKIVETGGDVGITRVSIPTAAFVSGLPPLGPTDAYVMVIADDAAFTSSLETVFMSTSGSDQTLLYDFDGTRFFTFGVAHRATNPLHISLDGFDDYVRISDANELGSTFSVMTWIRPDGANTLGDERTIIAKSSTATSGYKIVLQNDNKIRVQWYNSLGVLKSLVTNTSIPNGIWHNFAATYGANTLTLYIDGVLDRTLAIPAVDAPISTTSLFSIGSNYVDKNNILNLFKGDIDELRMWSRVLTPTEIRFILNQEILQTGTGTRGTIIPSSIPKNDVSTLLWSNLFAYYSMNSYIGTHLDDDSGNVHRGSLIIPNKISINLQTAPLPYESGANGLWSANASWKNGTIQDLPYSLSIVDGTTPINWNIVKTTHNVDSNGNKVVLGLLVNSNTLSASNDSKMEVSHYLKLDGKLDLVGMSQLIQTLNSSLDVTSSGNLERDQQGQKNFYNYNYWSSPVSSINSTTINHGYTVAGVMKDGTTTTPQNITWTAGLNGSATSPITLSSYWIFKFQNLTPAYANWQSVGQNGALLAGQGFTLKGSNAVTPTQNYTFLGKPNNGLITSTVAANNLNLSGNPYASAIDANAFISANNATTTGALYFWEHYSTNTSHNLTQYQGGYATRTLVGGTPPVSPVGVSGLGSSSKIPNRYIPVGQGFFIFGNGTGGTITFNNNQRAFIKENNVNSFTLFRASSSNSLVTVSNHFSDNRDDSYSDDTYKRIRLGFDDRNGYHRQTLLGFMEENATSGIDVGYDAVLVDNQPCDMYFLNGGTQLIINGDGYFNENNIYPIGVRSDGLGTVTFKIDDLENFNINTPVFIYDNVTDVYHNILDEQFSIELPQGTLDNRFSLRFIDANATSILGNNNFNNNNGIQIAYTTSENTLHIKNNSSVETVQNVSVFNILGQLMATWKVSDTNQQDIQLPIKNYSTGTYIVKIKTDVSETSRKIIVK